MGTSRFMVEGMYTDHQQRIDPCGWDEDEREYFVLDDNRLYRRTEPPIPEPPKVKAKPKTNSKKGQAARRRERAAKRRKIVDSDLDMEVNDNDEQADDTEAPQHGPDEQTQADQDPADIDTLGGWKWECIAVSLDEYRTFLDANRKTRDPNQKSLNKYIEQTVLPILQEVEEKRLRKLEARARREALEARIHTAKRSGRLAAKFEAEKEAADRAEAERHHALTLAAAHREEERRHQMESDRQSRMLTREQRIREREYNRILMEEQLLRDVEEEKRIVEGISRASARNLKNRVDRTKRELSHLTEDEWSFDCSGCHKHGKNFDDGAHSISCEQCNVWQHSKCLGISVAEAESEDFHFICHDCKTRDEDTKKPKISLKFKVSQSSSPPQAQVPSLSNQLSPSAQRFVNVSVPPVVRTLGQPTMGQFYPRPMHAASLPQHSDQPQYGRQGRQQQQSGTHIVSAPLHSAAPMNGLPSLSGPSSGADPRASHQTGSNHVQFTPQRPNSPPPSMQPRPAVRPTSSQPYTNGEIPLPRRVPSPVINKPTMSPSQGNPDVGPIAGVPGSSPSNHHAQMIAPQTDGRTDLTQSYTNGYVHSTPQQAHQRQASFNRTPSFSASQFFTQPLSGLSPTKQQQQHSYQPSSTPAIPLPPTASSGSSKQYTASTPSSSFNATHSMNARSVSGTPIFPPAEKLVPSPELANRRPIATPSKSSTPRKSPEIALGNSAAVQALQNLAAADSNMLGYIDGGQIIRSSSPRETEQQQQQHHHNTNTTTNTVQ